MAPVPIPRTAMPLVDDEGVEEPAREAVEFGDPTRRTFLAQERTMLAWWRTGLACVAVGLAVGRLLPEVGHVARAPYVALGVGYGVLGICFVLVGSSRQRSAERIFAAGRFDHLRGPLVVGLTAYIAALAVASVVLLFAAS